jgi:activator of 2-hydroxyglutaryl-CoA dehydratase
VITAGVDIGSLSTEAVIVEGDRVVCHSLRDTDRIRMRLSARFEQAGNLA